MLRRLPNEESGNIPKIQDLSTTIVGLAVETISPNRFKKVSYLISLTCTKF